MNPLTFCCRALLADPGRDLFPPTSKACCPEAQDVRSRTAPTSSAAPSPLFPPPTPDGAERGAARPPHAPTRSAPTPNGSVTQQGPRRHHFPTRHPRLRPALYGQGRNNSLQQRAPAPTGTNPRAPSPGDPPSPQPGPVWGPGRPQGAAQRYIRRPPGAAARPQPLPWGWGGGGGR